MVDAGSTFDTFLATPKCGLFPLSCFNSYATCAIILMSHDLFTNRMMHIMSLSILFGIIGIIEIQGGKPTLAIRPDAPVVPAALT